MASSAEPHHPPDSAAQPPSEALAEPSSPGRKTGKKKKRAETETYTKARELAIQTALRTGLDVDRSKKLEEVAALFVVFDQDGNGLLDMDELGTLMRAIGLFRKKDEVQELFDRFDDDKSGLHNLEEFLEMLAFILAEEGKSGEAFSLRKWQPNELKELEKAPSKLRLMTTLRVVLDFLKDDFFTVRNESAKKLKDNDLFDKASETLQRLIEEIQSERENVEHLQSDLKLFKDTLTRKHEQGEECAGTFTNERQRLLQEMVQLESVKKTIEDQLAATQDDLAALAKEKEDSEAALRLRTVVLEESVAQAASRIDTGRQTVTNFMTKLYEKDQQIAYLREYHTKYKDALAEGVELKRENALLKTLLVQVADATRHHLPEQEAALNTALREAHQVVETIDAALAAEADFVVDASRPVEELMAFDKVPRRPRTLHKAVR
uniref:EF-hand domain-containing protein n=1 Tax=Vitrella brassicaformis TaxID=1169539 RepID=A0A7S1K0M9_9ALVE